MFVNRRADPPIRGIAMASHFTQEIPCQKRRAVTAFRMAKTSTPIASDELAFLSIDHETICATALARNKIIIQDISIYCNLIIKW